MLISSALQQLRQQAAAVTNREAGFLRFSTALPAGEASLNWLGAQPVWPLFYWQRRDDGETLVACGEVLRASNLRQAGELIAMLPSGWRLVGANDFGLTCSYLFLPRLLWHDNELILFLHGKSLYEDAQQALAFIDRLLPAQPFAALPGDVSDARHHPDKKLWQQLVNQALSVIGSGGMDKVVLARATDLFFTRMVSPTSLLAASREVNHHCYHFLLAFNSQQIFLGSSPERLYYRQHRRLYSEALAGTCAGSPDRQEALRLAEALLKDEKNRRENGMVVEDICQRLQPITSQLDVSAAEVLRLRKVQHLRRTICGQLIQTDDLLCLARLQPTAAVAGLPRQAARQFIDRYEPFSRGWYAGSIGYLSAEESEFTVALRSAQVTGNSVRLYAGAGIVSGSDALSEWQEINQKAAGLGSLLGWK